MERSVTNSSNQTRTDDHELQQYPFPLQPLSPTLQVDKNARPSTGTRVRINSVAAEIPISPPGVQPSFTHVSEAESQESNRDTNDQTIAAAEQLLNAHTNTNVAQFASTNGADPFADDDTDEYAVTGNTQGGVFYQLLQSYKNPIPTYSDVITPSEYTTNSGSIVQRPSTTSGGTTPQRKKWHTKEKATQSTETLVTLVGASAKLANPNDRKDIPTRPQHKRTASAGLLAKVRKAKDDQDIRIKIHVANILKRQQYIIRMCRALMLFGAPTHRLEEYLATTAAVLEINSQFLYIPGCMVISFDDVLTHTVSLLYLL